MTTPKNPTTTEPPVDYTKRLKTMLKKLKQRNIHLYLLVSLLALYLLYGYGETLMLWYDQYVIAPYLSNIVSNILLAFLCTILLGVVAYDIWRKNQNRYRYNEWAILAILFISTLLIGYRFSGKYEYLPLIGCVSYVDAMWLTGIAYVGSALRNSIRRCRGKEPKSDISEVEAQRTLTQANIIHDQPIGCGDEDLFDLGEDVEKAIRGLEVLDRSKAWSMAITGPWGSGKTSFINLIIERLKDKPFEILHFTPRTSKTTDTIQEDFFMLLASTLAKYDSRCGRTITDYMAALQLIDNRGVIAKALNVYKIWNKKSLKEKIQETIGNIHKRILVVIDDFDRLSREEILEVLKLIDNNAAFPNIIFLTAYDQVQMNKYFGDTYNTPDACFIDKFFSLELSLPKRPHMYISGYVFDVLCKTLRASVPESQDLAHAIYNTFRAHLPTYLPTLRDAKRFINQFTLDYALVRGDVFVADFMGVQLIKYKYPEEYHRLYKREYLIKKGLDSFRVYELNPEYSKALNTRPILGILFGDESHNREWHYRYIHDTRSFALYFVNRVYGTLRVKDMELVFSEDEDSAIARLNIWLADKSSADDVSRYLYGQKEGILQKSTETYLRYAILTFHCAKKILQEYALWSFLSVIEISRAKQYSAKHPDFEIEHYKNIILGLIFNKEHDQHLHLARHLYVLYKRKDVINGRYLITENDIWPTLKREFIERIKVSEVDNNLIDWLHDSIESIGGIIYLTTLDQECLSAFRERINSYPNHYLKRFVRSENASSSSEYGYIGCDYYWEQIFDGETDVETFIEHCKKNSIPEIERVDNFWQLYKANNMRAIPFNKEVDLQRLIDSNLVEEVRMLRQLQDLDHRVDTLASRGETPQAEELDRLQDELKKIPLEIHLADAIKEKIDGLRSTTI